MKLIFDENVSPTLASRLAGEYPGSVHVRDEDIRADSVDLGGRSLNTGRATPPRRSIRPSSPVQQRMLSRAASSVGGSAHRLLAVERVVLDGHGEVARIGH